MENNLGIGNFIEDFKLDAIMHEEIVVRPIGKVRGGCSEMNDEKSYGPKIETDKQYSLAKILVIWALATIPMGILGWIVSPILAPDANSDPLAAAVIRMMLLTAGLIWLFALTMLIVWQEEGDLRWATLKRRLWLRTPLDPKTGKIQPRLFLWLVPFLAATVLWELALTSYVDDWWVALFPFFSEPKGYSMGAIFESPRVIARLTGAWWFLALFLFQSVFNTIIGEEFLFRGVLLPKLEGVFGRWSWLASGVLHGLYHVHQPWSIPGNIISCSLLYALPSWRFSSIWMGIIVHSAQSVYFGFLILGVTLGLA